VVHLGRGECLDSATISDRMLAVARQSGSDVQEMNARMWAVIARHHLGELLVAQGHADACIPLGTPSNQAARLITIFDPVVATLAESSRNLWIMGDTRGCRAYATRAVELAREIRHPESLSFALLFHAWMQGHREDWEAALRSTAEAVTLGSEHGLIQTLAWNQCVHGWALARVGRTADGLVELQNGIEDSVRIMGQVGMPQFHAMLAEVLTLRGDHARALDEIQRSLAAVETSHDRYFNADLHRLAAECHRALGEPDAAETAFHQAIETARAQGARTFELRAATALGGLWADRGEKSRAHALLQSVCEALGDAEDTVDIRRARACLAEWH
jgi:predicted ATPase